MSDYIDRQAAIDVIEEHIKARLDWVTDSRLERQGLNAAMCAIEDMPSADVQPVRHGHWMLYENQNQDDVNNGNDLYVCSNCNYSDIHAKTVKVPFCWHCGARMDGEYEAN